jgi:large subunit ribosomal protein L9
MRVVFLEDVSGVAHGGDVKEVKNGFARNYLIPKNLAVPATHNALQRINGLREQAEKNRIKELSDMRELAQQLEGLQVNVEMRAGGSGQLYGSVTNAIVAERLSALIEREVDRRTIQIDEPIRELGIFDISIRLHSEVESQVKVLVYPTGSNPETYLASLQGEEEAAEEEGEEVEIQEPEAEAEETASDEAETEETETEESGSSDEAEEEKES